MNDLHDLLLKYRKLHDEMTSATAGLRLQLEEVETPYREELNPLKARIKSLVGEFGQDIRRHGISVWIRPRTTWDNTGLTQYAQTHPEILEFRREISVVGLTVIPIQESR